MAKIALNFRTIIGFLFGVSALWMLLSIYGDFAAGKALLLSVVYIAGLISMSIFFQSSVRYMIGVRFAIILFLLAQAAPLLALFLVCTLFGIISPQQFGGIIPLITVFGLMLFCLMILWNRNKQSTDKNDEDEKDNNQTQPESKKIETERISVKQGSEIHIIKPDEIYYIEAYGDYVLIYTEKSKFIKEQTMLHFENSLPSQFIRIHRSYIVNVDYMIRLELFGKESYIIRLKNGVSLKASKTGYKLLKNRLGL